MNASLSGKTILITGGSSQLGQAIVRKARAEGARVLLTYFQHPEEVEPLKQLGAEAFELNLADMRAIDVFAKMIKEKAPQLDVVIHNAALVRDHTIQNMSEEDWDLVMTVDLKAPYYLTKKLLPVLFKRPISKIFMIISRAAILGGFGISNYAAAKAGLVALAKSLAAELGKKNILVNAVNPGFMKSRMTESLPEEVLQTHREASPLQQFSDPKAVAEFMAFLCSDQMTQVTGQVLHFESRKI